LTLSVHVVPSNTYVCLFESIATHNEVEEHDMRTAETGKNVIVVHDPALYSSSDSPAATKHTPTSGHDTSVMSYTSPLSPGAAGSASQDEPSYAYAPG